MVLSLSQKYESQQKEIDQLKKRVIELENININQQKLSEANSQKNKKEEITNDSNNENNNEYYYENTFQNKKNKHSYNKNYNNYNNDKFNKKSKAYLPNVTNLIKDEI